MMPTATSASWRSTAERDQREPIPQSQMMPSHARMMNSSERGGADRELKKLSAGERVRPDGRRLLALGQPGDQRADAAEQAAAGDRLPAARAEGGHQRPGLLVASWRSRAAARDRAGRRVARPGGGW